MTEFGYFPEAGTDRLASLVWQLAQELSVARARTLALESLLVEKGVLADGELSESRPRVRGQQAIDADRDALLDRLVRVLTETDDHRVPLRGQFLEQLARADHGAAGARQSTHPTEESFDE